MVRLDPEYGPSRSTQTTQTSLGNETPGLIFGSELDEAFAYVADGTLFLLLAGSYNRRCSRERQDRRDECGESRRSRHGGLPKVVQRPILHPCRGDMITESWEGDIFTAEQDEQKESKRFDLSTAGCDR